MKKQLIAIAIPVIMLSLSGCVEETKQEQMVGADRDAHGCIGSAGFRWCEATAKCDRPWELAQSAGFANTAEAFDNYCGKL